MIRIIRTYDEIENKDLILMASWMDAEGNIGISKINERYVLRIAIKITEKHKIDEFKKKLGGSITFVKSENIKHKDRYIWRLNGNNAKNLLEKIYPFLILKKYHAKMAINFYNECCSYNRKVADKHDKILYYKKEISDHSQRGCKFGEDSIFINDIKYDDALIYLAAFIDGDGSIRLHRIIKKYKNFNGIAYKPMIIVYNTNKIIIDWMYKIFGGKIRIRNNNTQKNNKICYWWYVDYKKAIDIINEILPYLDIKKEQAKLNLEYQQYIDERGSRQNRPEDIYFKNNCFEKMKKLNCRGKLLKNI